MPEQTPTARRVFAEDLFAGTTSLVTGGGTGLGRAVANALARAGSDLLLAARRVDRTHRNRDTHNLDRRRSTTHGIHYAALESSSAITGLSGS